MQGIKEHGWLDVEYRCQSLQGTHLRIDVACFKTSNVGLTRTHARGQFFLRPAVSQPVVRQRFLRGVVIFRNRNSACSNGLLRERILLFLFDQCVNVRESCRQRRIDVDGRKHHHWCAAGFRHRSQ